MVEVMKIMVTSFQRPCGHTAVFSALTLQQITVDPGLCQGHLDALGQVWVRLLWGHCSFLLGPGEHKVLFVPSKSLFPQSCGSSIIKSHRPPKSNSLRVLSLFAGSPAQEICYGYQNFLNSVRISLV